MLKVITGHEDCDSGNVVFAKGAVVGYLEQEAIEMEDRSIFDEVISSQQEILEAEQRLHELEASLNENSTPEKLAACGRARERYEALGGYRLESQVRSVLFGLASRKTTWPAIPAISREAGKCASRSPSCLFANLTCSCSTSPQPPRP